MSDKKRKQHSGTQRLTGAEGPERPRVHGRLSMRRFWDLVDPEPGSRDEGAPEKLSVTSAERPE